VQRLQFGHCQSIACRMRSNSSGVQFRHEQCPDWWRIKSKTEKLELKSAFTFDQVKDDSLEEDAECERVPGPQQQPHEQSLTRDDEGRFDKPLKKVH
jgi:hypothetical protein